MKRATTPQDQFTLNQRVNDFEDQGEQQATVEHMTLPGFLRRIHHKFHIDEMNRFGDKVIRTAESMGLVFVTVTDRTMGPIRVFPVPLLTRIYQIMSPQFGWPQIIELPRIPLEDGKRGKWTLRANEKVDKFLRELLQATDNTDVQYSIATVLQFLKQMSEQLKAEIDAQDGERGSAPNGAGQA